MPAFRATVVVGLGFLSLAVSAHCWAQEPSERETIEELRQEVIELRMAIRDLTKQLAEMEYQQLPRVTESPRQPLDERRRSVIQHFEPWKETENHQLPRVIDARNRPTYVPRPEAPAIPKNFRFPIDIERGTGTPTVPRQVLDPRLR